MYKLDKELHLDHVVEFTNDKTVFTAIRDKGYLRLFLFHEETGKVYTRNGRSESWEELQEEDQKTVIDHVNTARRKKDIPVYKIDRPSDYKPTD